MNLLRCLSVSALLLSLVPRIALADEPPSLVAQMQAHVGVDFLQPLVAHDQQVSGFSRMRTPPRERRLRMPATTTSNDQAGHAFLPFAIDGKTGNAPWHENDIVGCVYPEKGEMFVKIGDAFRPASVLVGVAGEVVPGVCKAAPPPRA